MTAKLFFWGGCVMCLAVIAAMVNDLIHDPFDLILFIAGVVLADIGLVSAGTNSARNDLG